MLVFYRVRTEWVLRVRYIAVKGCLHEVVKGTLAVDVKVWDIDVNRPRFGWLSGFVPYLLHFADDFFDINFLFGDFLAGLLLLFKNGFFDLLAVVIWATHQGSANGNVFFVETHFEVLHGLGVQGLAIGLLDAKTVTPVLKRVSDFCWWD